MVLPLYTLSDSDGLIGIRLHPVLDCSGGDPSLVWLVIRATGRLCLGDDEFDLDQFRAMLESGAVTTAPPEGQRIRINDLAAFTATDVTSWVEPRELVKEVRDIIGELNGRPSTSELCRAAYRAYLVDPSNPNRHTLREAYERVPQHLRVWLLSFDEKDVPIRQALGIAGGRTPGR